jgi:hypothetical protein
MSKYRITTMIPAEQTWVYEIEAPSREEAVKIANGWVDDGDDRPDPVDFFTEDSIDTFEEIVSVKEVK